MTQPQPLDLDAIDTVIAAYQQHPDLGFACCSAHPAAEAATALAAEVRRLRAELATARSETFRDAAEIARETIAPDDYGSARVSTWNAAANIAEHKLRSHIATVLPPRRVLSVSEYSAAWHAIEGAAGEEGADPATVLHAVLDRLGISLPAVEETHVVADDSKADTLPAWLHQRFGTRGQHAQTWDALTDDDRDYWKHEAAAVRRAVARGGFKTDRAAVSAAARP